MQNFSKRALAIQLNLFYTFVSKYIKILQNRLPASKNRYNIIKRNPIYFLSQHIPCVFQAKRFCHRPRLFISTLHHPCVNRIRSFPRLIKTVSPKLRIIQKSMLIKATFIKQNEPAGLISMESDGRMKY